MAQVPLVLVLEACLTVAFVAGLELCSMTAIAIAPEATIVPVNRL